VFRAVDPRAAKQLLPLKEPNKNAHVGVAMSNDQNPKQGSSEASEQAVPSNAEKNPDDWTTGEESMTRAQASYLKTLSEEAGEPFDPGLTKAEASKRIDALQGRTGRGRNH
jgi:acetyl-CoA acetyltransferase